MGTTWTTEEVAVACEGVRKQAAGDFAADGALARRAYLFATEPNQTLLVVDVDEMVSELGGDEARVLDHLQVAARKVGAVAVVQVSENWITEGLPYVPGQSIRNHPARKEALLCTIESHRSPPVVWRAMIERTGETARLEAWHRLDLPVVKRNHGLSVLPVSS